MDAMSSGQKLRGAGLTPHFRAERSSNGSWRRSAASAELTRQVEKSTPAAYEPCERELQHHSFRATSADHDVKVVAVNDQFMPHDLHGQVRGEYLILQALVTDHVWLRACYRTSTS